MVQFGLSLPLTANIEDLVDLAQEAETHGFSTVWMPDHVISWDGKVPLNIWAVLSVLSTSTYKIRIGSLVANIYRQLPSTLFQIANSLQELSKNRLSLGLGVGTVWDTWQANIELTHPIQRMKETIDILRKGVSTPIYVGSRSPKMKKLIAKVADGWVSRHACSVPDFYEEKEEVKRNVEKKNFQYVADVPVSFDDSPKFWKSMAYRYLLATTYFDKPLSPSVKEQIENQANTFPIEVLKNRAAYGSVDDVILRLSAYQTVGGANQFSVRVYDNDLEKFGEVISSF